MSETKGNFRKLIRNMRKMAEEQREFERIKALNTELLQELKDCVAVMALSRSCSEAIDSAYAMIDKAEIV